MSNVTAIVFAMPGTSGFTVAVFKAEDMPVGSVVGLAAPSAASAAPAEPVAYLRFRAAQQWSGNGNHDIENAEWLETCQAREIGDDKLPAFPVYAEPRASITAASQQAAQQAALAAYSAKPALTDEQIAELGKDLQVFKYKAFRDGRGLKMTLPEREDYEAHIAFARAIIAAAGIKEQP